MVSAREELERVEKDGGESERPIVSLKRGTIPRDPVERRGRHVMTPLEGNMAGASKPITVSMKQLRSRRRVRDGALIHSGSRPVASSCYEEPYARKCKYGSAGAPGEQSPGATRPGTHVPGTHFRTRRRPGPRVSRRFLTPHDLRRPARSSPLAPPRFHSG